MKLSRGRGRLPSLHFLSVERAESKRNRLEFHDRLKQKGWMRRILDKIFSRQKHKINQ
jgi:hypothetical protein